MIRRRIIFKIGYPPPKGELERVKALSNFQSYPAACTSGAGYFCVSKNRYIAGSAPGDFARNPSGDW